MALILPTSKTSAGYVWLHSSNNRAIGNMFFHINNLPIGPMAG